MDPRVKPEDDIRRWLFLFVIPAVLKRESIKSYDSFNFFMNGPKFMSNRVSVYLKQDSSEFPLLG